MTGDVDTADPHTLLGEVLSPHNRADPYPALAALRRHGPMRLTEAHLTVFSSFRDCDTALRHPASASDRAKSTLAKRQLAAGQRPRPYALAGVVDRTDAPAFLFSDPPDHTRLRRLVSKAFLPRRVAALQPEITALVDRLLDDAEARGHFDAVTDLAYPLAVAVICRLLGVPIEDEAQFGRASSLVGQAIDPFLSPDGELPGGFEERMQAGKWLRRYHHQLIAERRSAPRDDLMSALIAVEESGDQLTEAEIVSTCNLLLIAGHESTVSLIANAVLAMLRDPPQWAALAADAGRAPRVVEETLRFDPPAQLLGRIAAEDMTVGDTDVPAGEVMMLLLAAAHRDPDAHPAPDRFDPDRAGLRHLGFGHGAHFCLGAHLVRLEAGLALSAVAARFPRAQLGGEPVYKPNITLRGMSALPVATGR